MSAVWRYHDFYSHISFILKILTLYFMDKEACEDANNLPHSNDDAAEICTTRPQVALVVHVASCYMHAVDIHIHFYF
jgi:hypothetical protein